MNIQTIIFCIIKKLYWKERSSTPKDVLAISSANQVADTQPLKMSFKTEKFIGSPSLVKLGSTTAQKQWPTQCVDRTGCNAPRISAINGRQAYTRHIGDGSAILIDHRSEPNDTWAAITKTETRASGVESIRGRERRGSRAAGSGNGREESGGSGSGTVILFNRPVQRRQQ